MTKDERIALVNADIAAGRMMIDPNVARRLFSDDYPDPEADEWAWDTSVHGPYRFTGTGVWMTPPTGHVVSLNADDCAVLADRHEDRGNASLAYHWREMARRKRDEDRS